VPVAEDVPFLCITQQHMTVTEDIPFVCTTQQHAPVAEDTFVCTTQQRMLAGGGTLHFLTK